MIRPALHFVGFRGHEYRSAVRVWGQPDFIHFRWDQRVKRELHSTDTVVFAKGTEFDPPSRFNGQDLIEEGYI